MAAVGLQVSEPNTDWETRLGVRDEAVPFQTGSVSVGDVRVGDRVEEFSTIHKTPGMFVVVDVTLAAEGKSKMRLSSFRLLSGNRTYRPYGLVGLSAEPGFAASDDLVFEVDPQRIDDLVLEGWTAEILHGYSQRVRVQLGITPANAQDWRAAAAGQTISPARPSDRALP